MKNEDGINGPWEIGEACTNAIEIRDHQGYKVCDIMNDDQGDITWNDECRAHLIIGAPKMLEFLYALKADCEDALARTGPGAHQMLSADQTLGCVTRLLSKVEL